ncbi:MAG: hypothetical protein R2761_28815 [Acidimicrobiales bacterium]
MIKPEDLDNTERLEQHRRSIAMLTTGAWALRREDALILLGALVDQQLWAANQNDDR